MIEAAGDLWWKNAVIYCLDVETFMDGDGDGVGDFSGLAERIDYLAGLGVSCLWLMPFYPSAQRDDGYDVTDYFSVDPRLGDLGVFTEFVRAANAHGLKVIVDLVLNHTSNEHPWFQEARSDPNSKRRSYYIWVDEPPEDWEPHLVFPGEQDTNWTFDEQAGQYYLHHFYPHQPDLNTREQAVRDEMTEVIGFWIQQGIAGFRVDAVPYLADLRGAKAEEELTPHELLRDLRAFMGRRKGDSVLLGEVNVEPYDQVKFFGDEDELQMAFNFYVNQHLWLALARRDPDPVRKALRVLPPLPATCQWANFLMNHDELTLDKLTTSERDEVFAAFGPKEGMRLYGRGIRRRLPTMLEDEALMRLAYSLMFALPGSPTLFYGEEIGMGENLDVEGRLAVRTPMQWLPTAQGGFSMAPPERLIRPMPTGEYGPDRVNVAVQQQQPDSILSWMQRLIRRRRELPEFGLGACSVLDAGEPKVLAHMLDWKGRQIVALHNFDGRTRTADISAELGDDVIEVRDVWGNRVYDAAEGGAVKLDALGYRWLRLIRTGQETLL